LGPDSTLMGDQMTSMPGADRKCTRILSPRKASEETPKRSYSALNNA
jgi:hypothetical protein